ncbi:CDP-glycerol glycerophosphotransferase family protein [Salegentibacter chungangensis]|uniref:CDP-glycerol glycerophosphotransferase family protein n=1 Tax=Salegentibacter chungangensis TaxID=1335724 RepID=A0ABW3NNZ4_9FLAO
MKKLGLVITDGVGFRNFILSNFVRASNSKFSKIIIFSALPKEVFDKLDLPNFEIIELPNYQEKGATWFFRKLKEVAHLRKNEANNFGFYDNLKANYTNANSRRGKLTRLAYRITRRFNSEKAIERFYKLQQSSLSKNSVTDFYRKLLKKHSPDLLFFTHQRPPYIAPLIYAAEIEGIETCSFIFSWDNLASKGRMAGNFDHYLVWSDLMRSELLQFYSGICEEQIKIVGTPQFEPYVMKEYESEIEEFYDCFGLDRNLKTICFSCGDFSTSVNDPLYIETIAEAIINKGIQEDVNFLVRTSPAEEPERFKYLREKFPFIKWNYPAWTQSRNKHSEMWSQRVPSAEDLKDLRMILEFSDLGINMCSTMSLDFMIFDKPVINPVFGNADNGLYNDQRFLNYAHYKNVVDSGSVRIARDKNELIAEINSYLENPKADSKKRKELLALQISKDLKGTSSRISEVLAHLE